MNPESSLPRLPIEVWGQVFKHIDNPLVLMTAQEVCSEWEQEIKRILPDANWKKLCLLAIKASSLSSIAAVVQLSEPKINYQQINDKRFWRKVFFHYIKCISVDELPVKVVSIKNRLLLSQNEHITCGDIRGTSIMYGTDIGQVYVSNNDGQAQKRKVIKIFEKITEVKIWNYDTDQSLFLFVTQMRRMRIGYPAITTTLRGHKMCIGTANNLYYMQDNLLIKLKPMPPTADAIMVLELNFNPNEKPEAISSCESKIFVLTRVGKILRVFMIEDKSLTSQNQMFQVESIVEAPLLPLTPLNMKYHITLNSTIICLENNQMFLYAPNTNDWVIHNEKEYFTGKVTSVIVHGPCLILGFSTGVLSIYQVETIEELLSPDLFKNKPVKVMKLDTRPIITIKVADVDENIHIIAFSDKNMFTLIF